MAVHLGGAADLGQHRLGDVEEPAARTQCRSVGDSDTRTLGAGQGAPTDPPATGPEAAGTDGTDRPSTGTHEQAGRGCTHTVQCTVNENNAIEGAENIATNHQNDGMQYGHR